MTELNKEIQMISWCSKELSKYISSNSSLYGNTQSNPQENKAKNMTIMTIMKLKDNECIEARKMTHYMG